jgi:hypothetical protein
MRQRVQVAHQALQALFQYVSIDLRRRNIRMTQKGLYHAQIGAIVQKVAGKSVAKYVGADLVGTKAGRARQAL